MAWHAARHNACEHAVQCCGLHVTKPAFVSSSLSHTWRRRRHPAWSRGTGGWHITTLEPRMSQGHTVRYLQPTLNCLDQSLTPGERRFAKVWRRCRRQKQKYYVDWSKGGHPGLLEPVLDVRRQRLAEVRKACPPRLRVVRREFCDALFCERLLCRLALLDQPAGAAMTMSLDVAQQNLVIRSARQLSLPAPFAALHS